MCLVITLLWCPTSVISQLREPEMSLFSRSGSVNVSPNDWIILQTLATKVAVSSRAAQIDISWLGNKAPAIMFPLGLTTSNFYCSNLLLPLCRKSAQDGHATEQRCPCPGSPGVPSLAAKIMQVTSWCRTKSGERTPELDLNHF